MFFQQTKVTQTTPDHLRMQGPPKQPSSCLLYPVSPDQERWRKSRQRNAICYSPKASTEMEAGHITKQAKDFLECGKFQNENTRVHKDLSNSSGIDQ